MSRRLLLLLFPAVALALIVAVRTFSSPAPSPTPDRVAPSAPGAAEERGLPDGPEARPEPPAGGVLVLDRDGQPAEVYVATGMATEGFAETDWQGIGETGTDGILLSSDFDREPAELLIAGLRAGVGGPVEWDPAGVVIRLGDGCVVSGHVRDPEGNPVAGVMIGGRGVRDGVFSGDDGAYRLTGLRPGHTMKIGAFGGSRRPDLVEVIFSEFGEEQTIDFEIPAPSGRRLLIDIRFSRPPQAQPTLKLDLGGKRPATVDLPLTNTIVACPAPLAAGQEVEVTVNCPGFATATERVVMPENEETVRVTLDLVPGGLPLHGLVVDTEGAPVADAEVFGCAEPRLDADGKWTLRTDRHGRFRLRGNLAGHHLIAIVEAKGASRWLHLTPETGEVVLVLEDAGVVEGRVLDRDSGTPVEGATVRLSFDLRDHDSWTVESGPDGSYRFAGVPAGSFVWPWVAFTPRADPVEQGPESHFDSGIRSRTEAVEQGFAAVLENLGDIFHRDLPAIRYPGGKCRFVLKFPEGAATPKSVQVKHESRSDRWYRTSEWDADLDPDDPAVTIWLGQGTHSVHFRAGARTAAIEGITVEGDGDLPDRVVTFEEQARVVVQLVSGDGTPLRRKGIRVCYARVFNRSGSGGGGEMTDAAGRADVTHLLPSAPELRTEGLRIVFTLRGEGLFEAWPYRENANFSIPGPELADRIAAAASGEVVLSVPATTCLSVPLITVDTDGNPVSGVRLTCSPPEKFEETELTTDGNGLATVRPRFEPDRFGYLESIRAELPWLGGVGEGAGMHDPRFVKRDGGKLLVIKVQRAREVTVRVVDQDGKPLRGVVVGDAPFRREENGTTGADGRIRLHVVEGEAKIFLSLQGYTDDRAEVPPGVNEITRTLTRLRRVTIAVHVPKELAAESELFAEVTESRGATLVAGEDGVFRGEAETPMGSAAEVSIVSPDRRFEARGVIGPSEDSVELTMAPRKLYPVTFRCVDQEGDPIPDLPVALDDFNVQADIRTYFPKDIRTDAAGRLHAKLPAGKLRVDLEADSWSMSGLGQEFTVPAKEEVVLKLRKE